jgi:hydroxymethylglutaryl-CoA synthase
MRIRADEIARQWHKDPATIRRGLLLEEKSVPGFDEDTITISVAAGRAALDRAGVDPARVGAVYIGSESHPYAVKPSGTVVAEALGIGPDVHVADFEFACKAGTEAMFVALALVESGRVEYALAIGADTSQGAPDDALEYSASAGGAAYLFGRTDTLADVLATHSVTSDTPDFWRREGAFYPRHGGRFTGEPAYFKHVLASTRALFAASGLGPQDFRFAVFHMPNGKFPLEVGNTLGFAREQLEAGWIVPKMGNRAGRRARRRGARRSHPDHLVRLWGGQRLLRPAGHRAPGRAPGPRAHGARDARRAAPLSHVRRVRQGAREDHRQRLTPGTGRKRPCETSQSLPPG